MKKLISKDENQVSYLLTDNYSKMDCSRWGLTETTYLKTRSGKPFRVVYASFWHPYELRHHFRDFAANSPLSYVRLGKKLNDMGLITNEFPRPTKEELNKLKAQGLCLEGVEESWDLEKILEAIAVNISMQSKPWKNGLSNDNRTIKQAYGSRQGFREYLFKCYL